MFSITLFIYWRFTTDVNRSDRHVVQLDQVLQRLTFKYSSLSTTIRMWFAGSHVSAKFHYVANLSIAFDIHDTSRWTPSVNKMIQNSEWIYEYCVPIKVFQWTKWTHHGAFRPNIQFKFTHISYVNYLYLLSIALPYVWLTLSTKATSCMLTFS